MKRLISVLSAICILLSAFAILPSFVPAQAETGILWGDVDGNGSINARDIALLRQHLAALDVAAGTSSFTVFDGADCDGSGVVNSKDLALLRQYMASYDYITCSSPVKLGPDEPQQTETTEPEPEPEYPHDYSALVPTKDQFMIIYEPNGGTLGTAIRSRVSVSDGATKKITVYNAGEYFYQVVNDSAYLCPHAMGDKNYLFRSGYILYGYNTRADGSGDYYGCGWNVPITKGEKIVLYAMWAKPTADSQFKFSAGKITSYLGNEDTVVIPASISGTSVTEISSKAFSGKSVKTVILPKSIQTLASNAFYNCPQLGSVYMFDMITSMKSDSFANCPKLTTLYINNANSIKYVGASSKEGMYHMKFQRLLLNRDKKKIVIVSGSNAIFGILSPVMMEKLNNEYEVINYGTNFYCPSALYVEAVSHFVKEGDIVVITPEEVPEQWGDIGTRGKNQLFPAIEGCMEIISCLNIQNYMHWLPEIASMNSKRVGGSQSYESTYSEAVDEYGEFSYTRTQQNPKFSNTSLSDWFGPAVRSQCFTTENVKNLNRSFDLCVANGAKIYISFSVVDKSYVSDQSASNLKAYEDAAVASFVTGHTGRALISHVSTYLFDHSCFYNSMHHLLSEPSVRRSELLAEDILAQLKKEK